MLITLHINGESQTLETTASEPLLNLLRRNGFFGVKHGCETGECGACAVLVNGQPTVSCVMLAAQADRARVTTIEGMGTRRNLHPLQRAFAANGSIQCGYCTPAMVLAAAALLEGEPAPSEEAVRECLSGVLCRCTGYVKPVEAILHAAAELRGDAPEWPDVTPEGPEFRPTRPDDDEDEVFGRGQPVAPPYHDDDSNVMTATRTQIRPMRVRRPSDNWDIVGKPEVKVDAVKLALGKPAFTDDIEMRGMLHAKVLHSPHAHARITRIDATRARVLPGVHAVLTYEDLPRVVYSTAGQSDPIPGPLDMFSLDYKVRFVGDRVAFVAAETPEIAERALELIEVEYEALPHILDPRDSMKEGAVVLHDEPEFVPFSDSEPEQNIAARIRIDIGDVESGFAEADRIFEEEYVVPKVQQASIEPHVVVTWWDENDRLVIRTSTQVPFHVRRIMAPVLGLPPKLIRVIKPRIGGGFGGKQEVMIEDVAAHLTIATGRPVRYEYTREEEFIAARSRHPMRVRLKTGVRNDGTIVANEMYALSDTGAYGCHALTVAGNTGHKGMALYPGLWRDHPDGFQYANIRFYADIVYTNTPPAGAFRGYGCPQGFLPLEVHMERIAHALGLDPLDFRLRNAVREGDEHPFSRAWSEGREPQPEIINTCGLPECAERGAKMIGWDEKRRSGDSSWRVVPGQPHLRRGVGVALVMQGTAIPYLDMGAASIKMNDDGSFNMLVGATDLGTGSDTVLAQMAAEVLGCPVDDLIVYSSDTDFTPFDKGAYASSTTYISGYATVKAAEQCAEQIQKVAARLFNRDYEERQSAVQRPERGTPAPVTPGEIDLADRCAWAPDGRKIALQEIALNSLHHEEQHQIMGIGSYVSPESPPPFAAQFAQVVVDTETGQVTVEHLAMAVDSGQIVNPATASGQIEGGMTQALGYAVCEEMTYDEQGRPLQRDLTDYHIFAAHEMPRLDVTFVQTFEPSHPFGVKAVAEIPMDGVAPAVVNAIHDAVGVWLNEIPATPERVWKAMQAGNQLP
jgi:putative selenate reductase molybdopterin-binding subunit